MNSIVNTAPGTEQQGGLLQGMSRGELDRYFAGLRAPNPKVFQGAYRGKLYAVEGLRLLPRPLRAMLHMLVNSPVTPWKGKHFAKGRGGNMLVRADGSMQWGYYRVETDDALLGEGSVISLDYDVPENAVALWGIRGELREIERGYYLARMLYRSPTRVMTLLYFTLER